MLSGPVQSSCTQPLASWGLTILGPLWGSDEAEGAFADPGAAVDGQDFAGDEAGVL